MSRSASDDEVLPRGDLFAALQYLAADNVRLCDIAIAADKLAKAVERILVEEVSDPGLEAALDAYKVVRNGS